jgi:hypothetical protein
LKVTSLTDEIARLVHGIVVHRETIKEEYVKAWLATNLPKGADHGWIINNVQLVEKWSSDWRTVTWHLELKNPRD